MMVVSFALIMAIYEILIRHFDFKLFLVSLPPIKQKRTGAN